MPLETHTFESGLTVYVDHVPTAKTTIVSAQVQIGSINESPEQAGLSHVLEHAQFLGTKDFEDLKTVDAFSENNQFGHEANAGTGYTATRYHAQGPKFEPIMHYLSQVVTSPRHDAEAVNDELSAVRREALMYLDDPDRVDGEILERLMFNDPYGRPIIGFSDKLNFSAEEVRDFYKKAYRLGNLAIVSSGAATIEQVVGQADRLFNNSPLAERTTPSETPVKPIIYKLAGRYGLLRPDSPNANIWVAHALGEDNAKHIADNYSPYNVADSILYKKIYDVLRNEHHMAYGGGYQLDTSSHLAAWKAYSQVQTDPERVDEALEIFNSIDTICQTDLDYNKRMLQTWIGEVACKIDSLGYRHSLVLNRLDEGQPPLSPEEIYTHYSELNVDEVEAAKTKLIDLYKSSPKTLYVSGNKQAVRGLELTEVDF